MGRDEDGVAHVRIAVSRRRDWVREPCLSVFGGCGVDVDVEEGVGERFRVEVCSYNFGVGNVEVWRGVSVSVGCGRVARRSCRKRSGRG